MQNQSIIPKIQSSYIEGRLNRDMAYEKLVTLVGDIKAQELLDTWDTDTGKNPTVEVMAQQGIDPASQQYLGRPNLGKGFFSAVTTEPPEYTAEEAKKAFLRGVLSDKDAVKKLLKVGLDPDSANKQIMFWRQEALRFLDRPLGQDPNPLANKNNMTPSVPGVPGQPGMSGAGNPQMQGLGIKH